MELFIATTQVSTGNVEALPHPAVDPRRSARLGVRAGPASRDPDRRPGVLGRRAHRESSRAGLWCASAPRPTSSCSAHPSRRPEAPTEGGRHPAAARRNQLRFLALRRTAGHRACEARGRARPAGFGTLHRRLRNLRMHLIDSQDLTGRLSALSKFNAHPVFVRALRDEGRKQADKWLAANFELWACVRRSACTGSSTGVQAIAHAGDRPS